MAIGMEIELVCQVQIPALTVVFTSNTIRKGMDPSLFFLPAMGKIIK